MTSGWEGEGINLVWGVSLSISLCLSCSVYCTCFYSEVMSFLNNRRFCHSIFYYPFSTLPPSNLPLEFFSIFSSPYTHEGLSLILSWTLSSIDLISIAFIPSFLISSFPKPICSQFISFWLHFISYCYFYKHSFLFEGLKMLNFFYVPLLLFPWP